MKKIRLAFIFVTVIVSCSTTKKASNTIASTEKVRFPKFTEADSLRGTLTRFRSNYDVHFYELTLDIDIKEEFLNGRVDIHLQALNAIDTLQIDLYQNMNIDTIQANGIVLNYYRNHDAVFVLLPQKLSSQPSLVLEVYYNGHPIKAKLPPWDGGFVWKKDEDKNPWVGVACEGDGASLWWPLKDHIIDEPDSMLMHFTVPKDLFCVSNGILINQETVLDKTTFSWKTSYPINSYNATLYIGDFVHFSETYDLGEYNFPLDFYVLPHHLEKAKRQFKETKEVIAFYEKIYGPYPWKRENFKLIESPYEGMEHQSAIAYGDDYGENIMNTFFGYDYILVHETAHEWWGNSLTAPDFAEIWLHEGFATYSEALYMEETRGYEKYLHVLNLYAVTILNKRPIIGPYGVSFFDYDDSDVYTKGALLLHSLRVLIQDDTIFMRLLKDFYQQNAYSTATTQGFITMAEERFGYSLDWFFQQYLYTAEPPVLEYNVYQDYEQNKKILKYRWLNTSANFKLPVTISVNGKEQVIHPSQATQQLELEHFKVDLNPKRSYFIKKSNRKF